jgi:large subunit ribosomal protein L25
MKQKFTIEAESRSVQGTGASRRLRHAGLVPAIVYGGKSEPKMITVNHNELWKNLKHETFYSAIITLKIGAESEQVVLKDLHRHPVRETVMHMDLQRVLADVLLRVRVPLHFKGADVAPGVKVGGGVVEHLLNDVEVECLPANIPEPFEIDVSALALNESIHLSQIKLPEGVELVELKHDNDLAVVAIHVPRAAEEEPVVEAAATEVPAANQKAPDAKGGAKPAAAAAKPAAPAKKK